MGNTMQKAESDDNSNDYRPYIKETDKLLINSNKEATTNKCGRRLSKTSLSSSSSSLQTFHDSVHQQEDEISLSDSATTSDYDSAHEYNNSFTATNNSISKNSIGESLNEKRYDPENNNVDIYDEIKIAIKDDAASCEIFNNLTITENRSNNTNRSIDRTIFSNNINNTISINDDRYTDLSSLRLGLSDDERTYDENDTATIQFGDVISNALNSLSALLKSKNVIPIDDNDNKDNDTDDLQYIIEDVDYNYYYGSKYRSECPFECSKLFVKKKSSDNDDNVEEELSTIIISPSGPPYDLNFLITYFLYPALFAFQIGVNINLTAVKLYDTNYYYDFISNDSSIYDDIIKDVTFNLDWPIDRLLYVIVKCPSLAKYDISTNNNRIIISSNRNNKNIIEIVRSLAFQPAVTSGDVINNIVDNSNHDYDDDDDNSENTDGRHLIDDDDDDCYNRRRTITPVLIMDDDTIIDNFDRINLNTTSSCSADISIIENSRYENNLKSNQIKGNLIKEMTSSQNISEAGPVTAAADLDVHSTSIFDESSDLDYFSRFGGTGDVAENLRKQSLYVKFDPLLAAAASNSADLKDGSQMCCNQNKHCENGLSAKGTSTPANVSPVQSKTTPSPKVTSSIRYMEVDQDEISKLHSLLLKQMKKEESFQEEINRFRNENEELTRKLNNAENEIAKLNSGLQAALENETKLKKDLQEKIKGKQQLSLVMEEYEKTISQMVSRREEEKKDYEGQLRKIEMERDNTVQHLNNLEIAFNDIHQKYERGKAVNESLKKNEDGLKKSIAEYEKLVKVVENKYEMLKSHAATQLEKANQELELITQSYENEQAKLKALLRKSDVQINSLQDALDRKTKENQELTTICDELIVKLTSHSGGQS